MKLWRADLQSQEGAISMFATSERKVRKLVREYDVGAEDYQIYSVEKIDVPTTATLLAHWLTVELTL